MNKKRIITTIFPIFAQTHSNSLVLRFLYIFFLLTPFILSGQFYNGHQMNFGKNRVQYDEFYWQFFRYDDYDIYFTEGGRELSEYVRDVADRNIEYISEVLNMGFPERIIFVVYNTLSDFKQTNIGLSTAEQSYNIGGVSQILDNKVVLYFDGDHLQFEQQLRAAVAKLFVIEMLYGAKNYRQVLARSLSNEYPEWFIEGLVSYISSEWTPEIHNRVLAGIQTGDFLKLNRLSDEQAKFAGHAVFNYVVEELGESILSNILYLTRLSKKVDDGFYYVLGKPFKSVIKEVNLYYKKNLIDSISREEYNSDDALRTTAENEHIISPVLSPDGTQIVYATNKKGRLKVWIESFEKGKRKRLEKSGYILDQITDYSYPIFTWHPSGKAFTMFHERKGKLWFSIYDIEEKQFIDREFFYFDKVLSANYSNDGYKIVFSGFKNGQTDIWIHTISSHTNKRLTDDIADDILPGFNSDDSRIIFSSNRLTDSTTNNLDSVAQTYDLYEYNMSSSGIVLDRYTNTKYDNELYAQNTGVGTYVYLSDKNGVLNLYESVQDSAVEAIDTTIHFRKFTRDKALSDNLYSVLQYYYNSNVGLGSGSIYNQNGYNVFVDSLYFDTTYTPKMHTAKKRYIESIQTDSIIRKQIEDEKVKLIPWQGVDSIERFVDINNYMFEIETHYAEELDSIFFSSEDPLNVIPSVYRTNFYVNEVVNQIDFGFLNASYQPFTGDASYYSPGINMLLQFGINDLFEDYRITGGYRIAGTFDSNELILSLENLKKRLDKQFIFHRKALTDIQNPTSQTTGASSIELHKIQDYELMCLLKYPFDQVQGITFTPSLRYDKDVPQAHSNLYTLNDEITHKFWGGLKLEYIFDNSINKGLNLYNGTKAKVFFEYYNRLDDIDNYLFVFGLDFRKYFKIHRNIIWANRFAYSAGFGTTPLLYYLGSVDNWINIFSGYDTYNEDIEYDKSVDWAFQALATNMRGFNQNIRNGNSFALFNTELRVPLISYIVNQPIRSEILNNFQVIGFCDVGTAWDGLIPDGENAYNNKIVETESILVVIDKNYSPVVWGYGFGLRTKLFGYFLRADWAWGVDRGVIMDNIFYLSLSLDF